MKCQMLFVVVVITALLISGCGGSEKTPEEILQASADTMAEMQTVSFTIEREGEPIIIDPELGAAMVSATGAFEAPDSVYAKVKVDAGGIIAEAEVLWSGGISYFKLPPFIPTYTESTIHEQVDPTDIFSPSEGLPSILTTLDKVMLDGEEDLDGVKAYHISAQADGETITALVGGLVLDGTVKVDVWIEKKSSEVVKLIVTEDDGELWTLYFYDYGVDVEIPAP